MAGGRRPARLARRLDLKTRGARLHKALTEGTRDVARQALAEEAARIADRLDELDRIIAGKGVLELLHFRVGDLDFDGAVKIEISVDKLLSEARQQATALAGIIDKLTRGAASGARPGRPAPADAGKAAAPVSAIDQARARREQRAAGQPATPG